eukprot:gb/GECH01014769.1/.p1 GENE.gb/GECH01014769.1/~~gb/GECH01014769.1/.p1  ORF type:complete len:185 (+),score=34.92 gb/GECH01014769.1/:1-555(+)
MWNQSRLFILLPSQRIISVIISLFLLSTCVFSFQIAPVSSESVSPTNSPHQHNDRSHSPHVPPSVLAEFYRVYMTYPWKEYLHTVSVTTVRRAIQKEYSVQESEVEEFDLCGHCIAVTFSRNPPAFLKFPERYQGMPVFYKVLGEEEKNQRISASSKQPTMGSVFLALFVLLMTGFTTLYMQNL